MITSPIPEQVVAGCVVSSHEFITELNDVSSGTSMLLGPALDSHRAASILKNLHSLHLRVRQHSANAAHLAGGLVERGHTVHYPGLPTHPQHALLSHLMNAGLGYGGVMTLDVGTHERAARLMVRLQDRRVGYLAVSLGYFKTLFSAPGSSTSSEIPVEERHAMGLTDGLIRFSVGLDNDIQRSLDALLELVPHRRHPRRNTDRQHHGLGAPVANLHGPGPLARAVGQRQTVIQRAIGQHNRKFLAAIARHGVRLVGHATAQHLSQGLNDAIAHDMAVGVIDKLEMINVEHDQAM